MVPKANMKTERRLMVSSAEGHRIGGEMASWVWGFIWGLLGKSRTWSK
jgi:hypothetical protein